MNKRLLLATLALVLARSAVLAERVITIVNRCPDAIELFINGQTQGSLLHNAVTNRTYEDNWNGLIYTTANGGNSNGAQTTRAGFYGQTNYYYLVKDPSHLNVGISIAPKVISSSLVGNFCSTTACDSVGCANPYSQAPSTFPSPSDAAPAPPLFECPGSDVGYTISFCPEKTFPPPTGAVAIHPAGSPNKCLDVRGAAITDGTTVQIYDCNGTAAQRWLITQGTTSRVQLAGTHLCIDAGSSPSSGSTMKIKTCVDNSPAQAWVSTGKQLKFASKSQCLDLTNGSTNNGNRIQTWTCQNPATSNQAWATS